MLSTGGWIDKNNSDTPNTAFDWRQGVPGNQVNGFGYNAQSGPANSFAEASFGATSGTILSDWLLTPVVTLKAGAKISFYTTATLNTTFANDLQVYISLNGSGTNVGSNAQTPTGGDFSLLTNGDLNPTLSVNGYPQGWTQYTFTLTNAEVAAATLGRIGLRYYIPDTTTQGSAIGLDTFSFAAPTLFTRTVSGNWTDTTGWTPNGVPNGNTVTAQLVTPSSGANSVNLGGGTFTLNQLQFFGTGAGTWDVVNGTIVFDGTNPTFVNQGGSSGIVGLLPSLQLNANTTFQIDNASAVTEVTGAISGTGGLTKTGSGALVLIGTNTYSGGTTISAGTLQIGNGGTTGSIVGNVADNGTLAFDRSDTVTFGSVISGTGSLVQLGSGTLVLTGNSTYTGGTTISAGTLQIGNGGTTGSITGNVTYNGTLAFNRSDAVTFAGTISGTGSLAQLGSGTVTLTGNNTYSGVTTISAGTLQIGNGGTSGSITGNVIDNGTLAFDRSNAVTFGGAIGGTGSLAQLGSGTVTLTGNSTYTGGTTVSAGTLQIGHGGTSGSISGPVTDNGTLAFDRSDAVIFAGAIGGTGSVLQLGSGTVTLTGNSTYAGGTTISAGTLQIGNGGTSGSIIGNVTDNGTLAFDRSDSFTFTGAISGTGTVDQIGTGTLTLTGNNTYSGPTNVSSGTLRAGSATAFSANSAFSLTGLSVLDLNGFDVSIGSLTGVAGATVSLGAHTLTAGGDNSSTTYAGLITGTGGLTKVGTGTLTLSGTSAYSGSTNINAGVLVGGALNSLSSFSAFVIANAASLDISLADQTIGSLAGTGGATVNLGTHILTTGGNDTSTTYAGLITGSGGLTKVGLGTLTLSGTSIYGGATNINAGVLAGGLPNALSQFSAFVIANGALLDIGVADQTIGSLAGAAGAFVNLGAHTLTTGGDNTSTLFAGTILGLGGGGLLKIGTGIFTLAGANTYSGGTTISNGTLQIGNGGTSGSITGNVTDNGTLAFDRSDIVTFSGVISGTGSLVQSGVGTLVLTANNTYLGGTTISAGKLQFGNGGTTGGVTSAAIIDNGVLVVDRSDSITYGGVVSGTGSGVKEGNGTLTFTGDNTYSGGTTVNAGTLQLGNGGTTGNITGNVTDNGTLAFDRSDAVAFGGVITGTGNLVQIGSGTLTLTGNNSYSGGTTISNGALQVGNGGTTGSIIGNVTDNGILAFDRSDSVTFGGLINGTGTLVNLGSGALILTGNNSYSGGTAVDNGTVVTASNGALGAGPVSITGLASTLQVNSGVTLTNLVTLNNGGTLNNSGTVHEGASNTQGR
jgi:autotransporter-associated beta strand protein